MLLERDTEQKIAAALLLKTHMMAVIAGGCVKHCVRRRTAYPAAKPTQK